MSATLDAERELDAQVAEKVMGWTDVTERHEYYFPNGFGLGSLWSSSAMQTGYQPDEAFAEKPFVALVPRYSTDIAAAWLVVEKMRVRGFVISPTLDQSAWCATIDKSFVSAETAPLAICLAALAAVEVPA